MKLSQVKKRVEALLTDYPNLRDDKNLTIVAIWQQDLKKQKIDPKSITGWDMMGIFRQGMLSDPENVRRAWQKTQELNENLRGSAYNIRHNKCEPEVRGDIRGYKNI